MANFKNKKVWHSNLKYESPLTIRWLGDPMESKFSKGDLIAYFEVKGSDQEGLYYNIETEEIADKIRQTPKRQWITVNATGGNDEPADLEISGASQSSPEPTQKQSTISTDRYGPDNLMDAYIQVVDQVVDRFVDATDDDGKITDTGFQHIRNVGDFWFRTGCFIPLFEGQGTRTRDTQEAPQSSNKPSGDDTPSPATDKQIEAIERLVKEIKWGGESHDGKDLGDVKSNIENAIENSKITAKSAPAIISWFNKEVEHQAKIEEELQEPDDDLPSDGFNV